MGGRGQIGGGKRGNTGGGDQRRGSLKPLPLAGQTAFNQNGETLGTKATVDKWENKLRTLDHEQLLMVNDDGYAVAYFDGGKQSVSFRVPDNVDTSKVVLTHIHPAEGDRTIGGTFSDADLLNHIRIGFKETRAASDEGTYYFRAGKGADPKGFIKDLASREREVDKYVDQAVKKYKAAGKTLDYKAHNDFWLQAHDRWMRVHAAKNGYIYGVEK